MKKPEKKPKEKKSDILIRAIRLELLKPRDESWDDIGPLLRALAKATPRLLNAGLDTRIAIKELGGCEAVKAKMCADAVENGAGAFEAESPDGLIYQAILRAVLRLRKWGEEKNYKPFADLEIPGAMAAAISRTVSQAFARRDQQAPRFSSERILVRAEGTRLSADDRGTVLTLTLRPKKTERPNQIAFCVAPSQGTHYETLRKIITKELPHGDCKIQYDDDRRKWYALIAYEMPKPEPVPIDMRRVLAVHRGMRNALYLMSSTGERALPFPGNKLIAQRQQLQARARQAKAVTEFERGKGAKGHGKARRFQSYHMIEDKIARITHTFCQQAAAFAIATAKRMGCGIILTEDYNGIRPDEDRQRRRVLDRGPLYAMKQALVNGAAKDGITLKETPSEYISSTCPRCGSEDVRAHNIRTGIFHCRAAKCGFERPADWIATFWMLKHGGADMTVWEDRLRREQILAAGRKENDQTADDTKGSGSEKPATAELRRDNKRAQTPSPRKRARGSRISTLSDEGRTPV